MSADVPPKNMPPPANGCPFGGSVAATWRSGPKMDTFLSTNRTDPLRLAAPRERGRKDKPNNLFPKKEDPCTDRCAPTGDRTANPAPMQLLPVRELFANNEERMERVPVHSARTPPPEHAPSAWMRERECWKDMKNTVL